MRLVGARPETFACVGARLNFICLFDQWSIFLAFTTWMHLVIVGCRACTGQQRKVGLLFCFQETKKFWRILSLFFQKRRILSQKCNKWQNIPFFVLFLHGAKIHPKKSLPLTPCLDRRYSLKGHMHFSVIIELHTQSLTGNHFLYW